MASSLPVLVHNLAEEFHNGKCKVVCNSLLEYVKVWVSRWVSSVCPEELSLLAYLFERFCNRCIEIYELDPTHFLFVPRLSSYA